MRLQQRVSMARLRDRGLIVGRLLAHGRARYQFRSTEDPSYFVKLSTERGTRTLWGRDLERAITKGATQPKKGDLVGARRVGRDIVTVHARERDPSGRVVSEAEQPAHRTRWVVEKVAYLAERARLARRVRDDQADVRSTVQAHPELASTFLTLRGAQELAERRIADPKDRERFVALVREAMAGSIRKGEPLPVVRMRETRQRAAPAVPTPRKEPTR
jgi:hypothetical protein